MSIKLIEQHDMKDCGPACLSMIANHFGKNISISKLRNYSATNKDGTSLYGLIKAGEKIGLVLNGVKVDSLEDIYEKDLPVIAHIITPRGITHFVIIEKIKNNTIHIVDPYWGKIKMEKAEFIKEWTNVLLITEKILPQFYELSSDKSVSKLLLDMLLDNKKSIFSIFVFSIIINCLGIVGAFYFKFLVDHIIPSSIITTLHIVSITFIIVYIVHAILSYIRLQLSLNLSLRVDKFLMKDYYKHVLKLPSNFFETRKNGEILSRFNDIFQIREAVSSVTITILVDILMVFIGSIILYIQSSLLFFISLFLIPIYLLIGIVFRKKLKKYNKQVMEETANVNSHLIESFSGYNVIKSLVSEEQVFQKGHRYFNNLISKVFMSGRIANIQISLTAFIKMIITIIILWIGSVLIINDQLSLGELLTFNALIVYFLDPIERIINLQPKIQTAIASCERYLDIRELESENNNIGFEKSTIKPLQDITFDNVNFQYGYDQLTLQDINLTFCKNETTAIVGESGSGKSTIAKLLCSFYESYDGVIKYGNTSLKEINKSWWRKHIGYVSQENFMFGDTIKNNLLLGLEKSVTDYDIQHALKLSCSKEFIDKLPHGINTVIETGGHNLSLGQLQRLSLARVYLKKPEILILDEFTSALDTITEGLVLKNLEDFSKNKKTVIIITHKLHTIINSDKIYTIKKGKVLESGTHLELLNNNSEYKKMWGNKII